MRILMLTRFYLNGQTTHVITLCSQLRRFGHQPYLVMTNFHHPAYHQWLKHEQIPFSTQANPQFLNQLKHKYDFDLIHTHSAHTLELALNLGNQWQVPVVATCHYLDFQPLDVLAQADKIITISEEMQRSLPLPEEKTVMIENGVPIESSYRHKRRELRQALIVTRMTAQKEPGYGQLVHILLTHGWQVSSIGNWRPYKYGIPYSGWRVDLSSAYRAADLVIGTGRSVREGMAAGAAAMVLGDYLDGLVTEDNVTTLRYANFSGRATKRLPTYQALSEQVQKLTDPAVLQRLQHFSYEYARQHFDIKKVTSQIIDVYQACLVS